MDAQGKKTVVKNYLYSLSYQILLLIVPLVTMPHLARTVGIAGQGTYGVLYAVTSAFVMLGCVGLNLYGQREVAYCKDDPAARNRVFWEVETMRVAALSVALILYLAFVWFDLRVFALIDVGRPLYPLLFSAELISGMLDISWYYQGIENFKLQTIRNFVVKLAGLILILTLVRGEGDLWKYIVIMLASNLLGNGSLWLTKLRADPFVKPDLRALPGRLKVSLSMFLPQVATIVYAQLDRVMIGGLVRDGNLQVGIYDNAEKVVKIALTVVTSIALVMLSRVANAFKSQDREKARAYVRFSFRIYMLLGVPITFGLAALAPGITEKLFGGADGASGIAPVMAMLCPIILFIGGSSVFGTQYLLPTDRLKPYTASVFTGMVVNLIFNAALIPFFGAFGAAAATLLAEFSVLAVQMIALRKEFSPRLYLACWRNVLAGLLMFAALLGLGVLFPTPSYLWIFVKILAGAVIYFLLLILLRDPFLLDGLAKVRKKLFQK